MEGRRVAIGWLWLRFTVHTPWPSGCLLWPVDSRVWPPVAGRGLLWLAFAGCGWLRPAMVGRQAGTAIPGPFRFLPRSVDLRLPSSQVDPPCLARRDALDGLTVAATLAHELFSTCDCLEAPRRCAADSRRQCPVIRAGIVLPAALTSACVMLPVPREVAFVTCCLRRAHPSGVARRLKSACGVASCCCPPWMAPSRTRRLRFWSWMRLTLKAGWRCLPCLKSESVREKRQLARPTPRAEAGAGSSMRTCYLVDPASSHMLVSKIKPCMCKYELIRTVKLRMAH